MDHGFCPLERRGGLVVRFDELVNRLAQLPWRRETHALERLLAPGSLPMSDRTTAFANANGAAVWLYALTNLSSASRNCLGDVKLTPLSACWPRMLNKHSDRKSTRLNSS